ncbi:MAG: hypothetical protein HY002_20600 [Candidatus Rokubacteria bacterium]|nr:hypothetical protein [Candidatus Rokubacteria bacterium]
MQIKFHDLEPPKLAQPRSERAQNAFEILLRARESADALLKAYDLYRAERGHIGGISTDAEQDMLRAMLVMAAAGLDATAKQLVKDCLPTLAKKKGRVREGLEKFIARSIRPEDEATDSPSGPRFLGRVLAAGSTQDAVIEEYVRELTGGSLQSADQVFRVFSALGLPTDKIDRSRLQEIFLVRNKIIHELDIALEKKGRKRIHRGLDEMMRDANYLLELSALQIRGVDVALESA